MRNDHIAIQTVDGKAHRFLGTLVAKDEATVPCPSDSITLLDLKRKPKTFTKGVLTSEIIVLDLMSGTDLEEAELIIKLLRQPLHETSSKQQVLVVVSSVLAWANTNST